MARKLEITTVLPCSNMCSYCPQTTLTKAYGNNKKKMSFEEFKQMMANVPTDVGIDFAGFSEMFLNRDAAKMIRWTVEQGYRTVVIYTTLFGFNEEDAETLSGLTLEGVAFHQYDGKSFNLEDFERKIELFKSKINAKSFVRGTPPSPLSRGGTLFEAQDKIGSYHCSSTPSSFDHNITVPNGDVYICCMDYGLKHKIGNLFETHYDELNRQYLHDLANKQKSDSICRKCELCVLNYSLPTFK